MVINAGTKKMQKLAYSPENIKTLAEFNCLCWIKRPKYFGETPPTHPPPKQDRWVKIIKSNYYSFIKAAHVFSV